MFEIAGTAGAPKVRCSADECALYFVYLRRHHPIGPSYARPPGRNTGAMHRRAQDFFDMPDRVGMFLVVIKNGSRHEFGRT
jgi:hypothetical protein